MSLDITPTEVPAAVQSHCSKLLIFVISSITLLIGGVTGYLLAMNTHSHDYASEIRLGDSTYTYINPLLDYQDENNPLMRNTINDLRDTLTQYFDEQTDRGRVTSASLYYRDLNNGPTLDVHEDTRFTPASLLKIPILIGYLKVSELDPSILDKTITYDTPFENIPTHNVEQTPSTITVGQTYTVRELLEMMATESDNVATLLLQNNIDVDIIDRVYNDFGITLPDFTDPRSSYITTREYSGFFRILYNSTYLNRENSEYALSLLGKSTFKTGLRAGVPSDVLVSNKFGASLQGPTNKQLHDCGIIYDPLVNPYILCIMTSGTDFEPMTETIAGATKIIHSTLRQEAW